MSKTFKFYEILKLRERYPHLKFNKKRFKNSGKYCDLEFMYFLNNRICYVFKDSCLNYEDYGDFSIPFMSCDDFEVVEYGDELPLEEKLYFISFFCIGIIFVVILFVASIKDKL